MKYFLLIVIIVPFLSVQGKKTCESYLGRYSAWHANFTQCTLKHAVPIAYCESCQDQHKGLTISYDELLNAEDTILHQKCKDLYFNKDRLNVIETVHKQAVEIWEKGFCSDCLSKETQLFKDKMHSFEVCLNNTSDQCQNCSSSYSEITDIFKSRMKALNGSVCFAIQDKMNTTSHAWEAKCGKKEHKPSLAAFTGLSSSLLLVHALFYGGFAYFAKTNSHDEDSDNEHVSDDDDGDDVRQSDPQPMLVHIESSPPKTKIANAKDGDELTLSDSGGESPLNTGLIQRRNDSGTELRPYSKEGKLENDESSDDEPLLT